MLLQTKQRNLAVQEMSAKLRLESIMMRALRPLFTRMNRDFRTIYSASRTIIDFNTYRDEISSILGAQYRRSQREFRGVVLEQNEIKNLSFLQVKQEDEIDQAISLGLLAWINQALFDRPDAIIATTDRDARVSLAQAEQSLLEEGEDITAQTVALTAAVINRRKLFGRIGRIATFETQSSAEATKTIEAEAISGRVPFTLRTDPFSQTRLRGVELKDGTKQWITVNDSNVRITHNAADRQIVNIDEFFTVGGARLRQPGDSSLNPPLREIMNCRCAANLQIQGL